MTPYITPAVLRNAPTGIAWNTVPYAGATIGEQNAEMTNVCVRVSDTIDEICNQPLRATYDTEEEAGPSFRLTLQRTGVARMVVSRWPVLALVSAKVSNSASFPRSWTDIPLNQLDVEYNSLGLLNSSAPGGAAAGPASILVAPGYVDWRNGRDGYRLSVTYINGWPHCGLTAAVASGANALVVDDTTGWEGVQGTIYDGANTEAIHVSAVSVASGAGTLTLSSNLTYAHASGVLVSSLPSSIQLAAIYLAVDELRIRGVDAVMVPSPNGGVQMVPPRTSIMKIVKDDLLKSYKRVI